MFVSTPCPCWQFERNMRYPHVHTTNAESDRECNLLFKLELQLEEYNGRIDSKVNVDECRVGCSIGG